MKILTFLGPSNYAFTKYRYGGKTVPTRFFAEALPQYFPGTEKILVFVTPTVQKHSNLEELSSRLGDLLHPVPIPESHTEEALWQIFDALIGNVEPGEEVVFDITNSFRSIPFLVFIAAAFLRSVRNVRVKAVLYGAFEAKGDDNVSPVFDLTPFITMFDWLAAANQFLYTGNARYLASQLKKSGKDALAPLADNVRAIAQGLELLRPRDVAEASLNLPRNLASVQAHLPKPFGVIVQPLEEAYARFGVQQSGEYREHLRSQLEMINWYLEKERYVQALSMAREWVVSLVCTEFDLDMWDKAARDEAEFLLNYAGIRKNRETGEIERESPYRQQWKQHPHRKRIARLWQGKERGQDGRELNLANLRNDVLHSGFRKNPKAAENIISQTEQIVREINAIAHAWNL